MYNIELLLSALDSFMESSQDRLTSVEMQLLADIRAGIASNQNDQAVEEHFFLLFNFLMMIKDYIDKMT